MYAGKKCSAINVELPKNDDFAAVKSDYIMRALPCYNLFIGKRKIKKTYVEMFKLKIVIDVINYCKLVRIYVDETDRYYGDLEISSYKKSISSKFEKKEEEDPEPQLIDTDF